MELIRKIVYAIVSVVFLSIGFCSAALAEVKSTNPIYCHQGECFYCTATGCVVMQSETDKQIEIDNTDQASTTEINQLLSTLEQEQSSTAIGDKIAAIRSKLHQQIQMITPKAKKLSRDYMSTLKTNADKTYKRLKAKNQQMVHERATQASAIPEAIMQEKTSSKIAHKTLPRSAPIKTKVSTHKRGRKKVLLPKPVNSAPAVNQPIKIHAILNYKPTIDFAQYALRQGNARSSNLIEAFIPLYQSAPNTLSFADIRFYNPNGTSVEGNIDLGFRRLFQNTQSLLGVYAGYDRFRDDLRNYYNQATMGLEVWMHLLFLGGNIYLPFGTQEYDNENKNYAFLVPTEIGYRYNIAYNEQGRDRVLPGGDAEIGYDITSRLTFYAGGYYFHHKGWPDIAGPKLRATYTIYRSDSHRLLGLLDRIRLEGLITHDKPRGTSWLVGLRFTFGLSKYSNPTKGLARHMVDPIRRDLNVISENETVDKLYMIDGRPARVDLVSDTSERNIDDAVAGNGSPPPADIIGVIGSHTANNPLEIGSRGLDITGGKYQFTVAGQSYTIETVGQNGQLMAHSTGETLFDLSGGAQDVTLEHITLNAATDQFAINNDGSSFGHLTINDTKIDAPILLKLSDTDATGEITFVDNVVTLTDSTATDSEVRDNSGGLAGLGLLVTDSGDATLTISAFHDNQFMITNNNTDLSLYALDVESHSAMPVTFTTGMQDNEISIQNNFASASLESVGFFNDQLTLRDSFFNNQISVKGYATPNAGMLNEGIFNIDNNGDFSKNQFIVSNDQAGSGIGVGWAQNGNASISGDMIGNKFKASSNQNGDGYGWRQNGTIEMVNMIGNTVTASGNNVGWGWYQAGETTISEDMIGNEFTASNSVNSTGHAWQQLNTITLVNMTGNTFTASGNSIGAAWQQVPDMTITGDMSYNKFIASNSPVSSGIGWLQVGTMHIIGDMIHNEFIASNNDDGGIGWRQEASTTINGNMSYNKFTTSNSKFSSGIGWLTDAEITILNNVTHNTFIALDNATSGIGWEMKPASFGQIVRDFSDDNTFTIKGNASEDVGIDISTSGTFTFSGFFSGNEMTLNDTVGGANTYGVNINISSGAQVTFDDAVVGNTITLAGSMTGDNYGFNFQAGSGTIELNNNVEANFSGDNNGATFTTGGNVIFSVNVS